MKEAQKVPEEYWGRLEGLRVAHGTVVRERDRAQEVAVQLLDRLEVLQLGRARPSGALKEAISIAKSWRKKHEVPTVPLVPDMARLALLHVACTGQYLWVGDHEGLQLRLLKDNTILAEWERETVPAVQAAVGQYMMMMTVPLELPEVPYETLADKMGLHETLVPWGEAQRRQYWELPEWDPESGDVPTAGRWYRSVDDRGGYRMGWPSAEGKWCWWPVSAQEVGEPMSVDVGDMGKNAEPVPCSRYEQWYSPTYHLVVVVPQPHQVGVEATVAFLEDQAHQRFRLERRPWPRWKLTRIAELLEIDDRHSSTANLLVLEEGPTLEYRAKYETEQALKWGAS